MFNYGTRAQKTWRWMYFFNMRFRIFFLQLLLLSFCIYSFFFSFSNRRKFAEGHMVCAEKLKDVPCTYSPQAIMKSNA